MNDCIFCKIASGEIPAQTVYEDGEVKAFLDIEPTNPGHVLVIPKNHSTDIYSVPEADFLAVMRAVHHLTPAVKNATHADGMNVIINNEYEAGQRVFHIHVHIIPRFNADGLEHWHGKPYPDGEMDRMREEIIRVL